MTLRLKEKELVATAISVATGCRPCTDYHLKAVREAKASEPEIATAIDTGLAIRERAAALMRNYAGGANDGTEPVAVASDRTATLVAVGSAFAVNCTASLAAYLAQAETAGISSDDVRAVTELSTFIKGKAASHVDALVPGETVEEQAACC